MEFEDYITFFGTEDLDNTTKFYQNILGLDLYKDQGVCKIFTISAQAKIGFCEHMEVVLEEKSPIITFITQKVDNVYKKLRDKGIEILNPPKLNPKFQIYHFFLKDPNGYTIEIQKFLEET
ncbi:MAG: VOC family protein [Promethearchaeota archaeon]|nr:MAG: VOC family protein [Candidatus Lokiarchaeota archaeon]